MDNFIEPGSFLLHVAKVIVHDDWNPDSVCYDADIALVRVTKQIQFNDFVKPICLFKQNDKTGDINEGWFVGFGESSNSFLRKLKIPILPTQMCLRVEGGYADKISHRMFCAGSKSISNICPNDMGDGLFVNYKGKYHLAGIASFVYNSRYGECDLKNTALFTNVHWMSDWIDQHLKPNQFQQINFDPTTSTKKSTTTTTTTTRTTKRPVTLDVLFFPSDDDYDYNKQTRWKMTSTTPKHVTSSTSAKPLIALSNVESDEPTFDINAKKNSTSTTNSYQQHFTEKPVPSPMANDVTKFQFDCGRMEHLKFVNGGKTAWNEFPWTSAIVKRGNMQKIVMGTLLSFRHVFVNIDELKSINTDKPQHLPGVNELQIFLGLNDLKKVSSATSVGVDKILTNPQLANYGILILSQPVDYGKKIFPICLLESTYYNITTSTTTNLYAIGFDGQERKSSVYNVRQGQACKSNGANRKDAVCVQRSLNCLLNRSPLYGKLNDLWYLIAGQNNQTRGCDGPIKPEYLELLNKFTPWMMTTVLST